MSKTIIIVSMTIFGVAMLVLFQSFASKTPKLLPSEAGITPIVNVPANKEKIGKLDILFIGNSYTFMHSMPQMILNIAKSDHNNAIELNIQSITISSARLKEHWNEGSAAQSIQQKPWDFVVLQDQSDWATLEDGVINNLAYITRFKQITKQSNEKAIITVFKTWPKQKDSGWYKNAETRNYLRSHNFMRLSIDQNTTNNANKANVDIVPISDYWLYILDNNIPVRLYEPDGSHPSVAGSYLNALVFYRYFTMSKLENIPYAPVGINKKAALKLQEIAKFGNLK